MAMASFDVRELSLFMAGGGGGDLAKSIGEKKQHPLPPQEYMGKNRPPPSKCFKNKYVSDVLSQEL